MSQYDEIAKIKGGMEMVKVREEKEFYDVMNLYPYVMADKDTVKNNKMVPKNMEVTNKIGVTIIAASKTTLYKKYFETESLLSATRIVNTFKPKRYHKIVDVHFEEVGVMV